MLFLAERALFRTDRADKTCYAYFVPRDIVQICTVFQRFRVIPSGEVDVGEELLIASRRIAFALTDTLANEARVSALSGN